MVLKNYNCYIILIKYSGVKNLKMFLLLLLPNKPGHSKKYIPVPHFFTCPSDIGWKYMLVLIEILLVPRNKVIFYPWLYDCELKCISELLCTTYLKYTASSSTGWGFKFSADNWINKGESPRSKAWNDTVPQMRTTYSRQYLNIWNNYKYNRILSHLIDNQTNLYLSIFTGCEEEGSTGMPTHMVRCLLQRLT